MILVLNNADFSDSNIGTIEIPRELSQFTKDFLTHYTKSFTDTQKYAVDDFLTGLIDSGIWNKLYFIFFPILAQNINEAFYDPIRNATISSTTYYRLVTNGISLTTTLPADNTDMGYVIHGLSLDGSDGLNVAVLKADNYLASYLVTCGYFGPYWGLGEIGNTTKANRNNIGSWVSAGKFW